MLFMGDSGTGKTAIINAYLYNIFPPKFLDYM